MQRGDAGYKRSQRRNAVVLFKATASNLALESREDPLHAPVEGRGWKAWAGLVLTAVGTHGRSVWGTERRKTSPSSLLLPPSAPIPLSLVVWC